MPKLLTLVVTGRNDAYMGNFLYRLTTCLNFASRQLERLHRLEDVEFLVTDWGSEKPLSDVLNLSSEAQKIVRFVYVPPEIAKKSRGNDEFFPACALNTSIRRGKGEFILSFDADSLFPFYSFQVLFDLLENKLDLEVDIKKTFFFLNRHRIPWEAARHFLTVEDWERYLILHTGNLPKYRSGFALGFACASHMMHRDLWQLLRGYNERFPGLGGMEAELSLRATQMALPVDLAGIGLYLFHMEHWPRNQRQDSNRKIQAGQTVSRDICVNGPEWGLGQHDLEMAMPVSKERQKSDGLDPSDQKAYIRPKFSALSPEALFGEIHSEEIGAHVLKYTEFIHPLEEEEKKLGIPEAPKDIETFFVLSWYALNHFPRAMLDFGVESRHDLGITSMACRNVEIFAARPWFEADSKEKSPLLRLLSLLNHSGYCGYMRHITGDPKTAIQRFATSSHRGTHLDLVILHDGAAPDTTLQQLPHLAPLLAPGALVFLKCETETRLQELLSQIQSHHPCFHAVPCASGQNAMLFNEGQD